jgi:nucleoside-diphosphate-sugar epimerase
MVLALKLLLTGASGFFGSNLVDLLLGDHSPSSDRPEIHVINRRPAVGRPGLSAHQADLMDPDTIASLMSMLRPTHLCHLAWLGPEHQDRYRSAENARWADASKALFDSFKENGGQRLVQLGSCIEYGNARSGVRVEHQPLEPDTAYGEAKATLSEYVVALGENMSTAVARPFFSYGPHEQPERLVPSLILALRRGESIDLTEGRQVRDYIDARDVASALWTLLTSDVAGAYNIGTGAGVQVRTIAEQLGQIAGRPELLNFGARAEGADSAAEIVADVNLLTSATNWKPSISLERGLEDATEWWLRRRNTEPPSGGA